MTYNKTFFDLFDDILTKDLNSNFFTSIFDSALKVDYPFDAYKENSDLFIEIPAIGLSKSDISIETENDNVRIFYKKAKDKIENREYFVKKIINREFDKTFKISDKFDTSKIEANLDKGALIIKIPKKQEEIKNKKIVNIN